MSNQLFEIIFLAKPNISEATTIELNVLAETASHSLSKELQMAPDRTTPLIPLITDLPVITTKFSSVGNMVNFEQKSTVRSQAVTHRLATELPTPAGSTQKPWDVGYYSPSALGPLGKPDRSEIKEKVPQSTTVISRYATDSWDSAMEDIQTQESVDQIEQIEVGPLVTSMAISKHIPSKEFSVTETPFVSTTMTLESKTETKTVSTVSDSVTTTRYEFTLGEDDGGDRTFTVRSDQSTLEFSQIPEVITVSKTSEDTTWTQLEDAQSVSASTIVPPVTMPDNDGSSTDNWEEKQTNGRKTEDFFGQDVSTTPFPSQRHTEGKLFPYSNDKRIVEGISTVMYPSSQREMTQGRERTETLRPEMRTDTYANDEIQEKITEEPSVRKIEEESLSGMKLSTASSERIHLTDSSVEMTKYFDSPAVTTQLSVVPAEARDMEEDFPITTVGLETDGYQDTMKYDEGITTVQLTHSTLNGEVVTVSKWSWDEDNTTSKPLVSTEHAGAPKSPPVLLTTTEVSGQDKEIPSFTEGGDEFTLIPNGTQKPLQKFTEQDTRDNGRFPVRFQPTASVGFSEKSTMRDSTTEERILPTTSMEGGVVHATREGSALDEGEDIDASQPISTVPQPAHTSLVEESAFVNYSSTQEPLSVIPKTKWGMLVPSVPSEDKVLGEPSEDTHTIDQTHLEITISPETIKTTTEVTQATTQEDFSQKEQTPDTPVPAPSSTVGIAKEATPPLDEQESDGSAYTVSEDQLETGSERVAVLETTSIGQIEHSMSYPPAAVTEPKGRTDEVVTLTPSLELPEFSTITVTVPSDITMVFSSVDRLHPISASKTSSVPTEKSSLIDRETGEETASDTSHVPPTTLEDIVAKETETYIGREYSTTSSTSSTQPTRPPTVGGKEAIRPPPLSTPEPLAGKKFHPDINIFIIEVRENKTGKFLLSRHYQSKQSAFYLENYFWKKKSTYQMLPLEDNWSVKKLCFSFTYLYKNWKNMLNNLEEC